MSEKLSSPPLFYALIQVIFNPIIRMENYVPVIQEEMRKIGYSDFLLETFPNININIAAENFGVQPTEIELQKRWLFNDAIKQNGYVLNQSLLVFHTTAYTTFRDFSDKAIKGVELLHKAVKLDFLQRVAMRYINLISPEEHESVNQYLNVGIQGIIKDDDAGFLSTESISAKKVSGGTLVVRTSLRPNMLPNTLPGDLLPLSLLPQADPDTKASTRVLLDEDFFMEERFVFDINILKDKLNIAHDEIEKVFFSSATEFALKTWR